jgi:hypothetical protein
VVIKRFDLFWWTCSYLIGDFMGGSSCPAIFDTRREAEEFIERSAKRRFINKQKWVSDK